MFNKTVSSKDVATYRDALAACLGKHVCLLHQDFPYGAGVAEWDRYIANPLVAVERRIRADYQVTVWQSLALALTTPGPNKLASDARRILMQ